MSVKGDSKDGSEGVYRWGGLSERKSPGFAETANGAPVQALGMVENFDNFWIEMTDRSTGKSTWFVEGGFWWFLDMTFWATANLPGWCSLSK